MDLLSLSLSIRKILPSSPLICRMRCSRVGDIAYLPGRRFACRPAASTGRRRRAPARRLAAMHFERVTGGAQSAASTATKQDAVLNLLAIAFEETSAPSGTATLDLCRRRAIQVDAGVHRNADERSRPGLGRRKPPLARGATPSRSACNGRRGSMRGSRPSRRLRGSPRREARGVGGRGSGRPAIIEDVVARRRRGADRLHPPLRRPGPRRRDLRITAAEIDARTRRCPPEALEALRSRGPHRGLSPAPEAAGRPHHRCARRRRSAGAGRRSKPSGSTCPAAPRAIPPRC